MDKPASRHFSVLIIDDEPQVTSELRELLENSGYRCVTSTHRESAIASFQADPNIGLVICDLYLGQDNGIRLIESLKGSRRQRQVLRIDHPHRSRWPPGK